MSTNLSRRAMVRGAAAAPVLAATTAIAAPHADAELLALGAELEPIMREWEAKTLRDCRARAAYEVACERAGLPRRKRNEFQSYNEWRAYMDRRLEVKTGEEADVDEDGCDIVWNSIGDRM
jgi:hypothetical protein